MVVPPIPSLFHWRFLTGNKPLLTLEDEFLRNHTKVLLTSDASDKIWEVKLDGDKLAGGWEEFAAVHNFRVRKGRTLCALLSLMNHVRSQRTE